MPSELGTVTETVYDVKADSTRVSFKESIITWRIENIRCVELIPAGLEASAETVHEVKADSTEFSLRITCSVGEQRMLDVLN